MMLIIYRNQLNYNINKIKNTFQDNKLNKILCFDIFNLMSS